MPGAVFYGIESNEPTWVNVRYEIRVQGDTGFLTRHIYASRTLAGDSPVFGLGGAFARDDYPFHPFAVVMGDIWDDVAFACALAANVLARGSACLAYVDRTGYTSSPANGAAITIAEGGLAHLVRVTQ